MLDDLKYIHHKDAQDALGTAEKQYQQLAHKFDFTWEAKTKIDNVVFAGMGGSAQSAALSTTWPGFFVPFEIVRGYEIPPYVGENTLFIASSYSGNTEETLSALESASKSRAQIVVISSGGILLELAKERNYPYIELPDGMQPRFATFYSYKALTTILDECGLTKDASNSLNTASTLLEKYTKSWRADVASKDNLAKQIALDSIGRSIVIYSGPKMHPAAYFWKISFNENAKNVAWIGQYPEFSHNEFLGWSSHPTDKPYTIIDLRSNLEHPQVQKRFEVTERMLSGMRPSPIIVQALGETLIDQLLWLVVLGDFVSIYTALLNGVNPTSVDLIEKMKQQLAG